MTLAKNMAKGASRRNKIELWVGLRWAWARICSEKARKLGPIASINRPDRADEVRMNGCAAPPELNSE